MKKLLFFAACGLSFGLNAQSPGVSSILQPSRSGGYIYWEEASGANFKVNVYRLQNGRYQLISSYGTKDHYFRFNSAQLLSSDLFYTIAVYDPTGTLVSEGEPVQIGPGASLGAQCHMDCNGLREAYRLSRMVKGDGTHYLMASDGAVMQDVATGLYAPYYQAIDSISYYQLPVQHPYREAVAQGITNEPDPDVHYIRAHIKIKPTTPGGPFFDAQNNVITKGWLVEKKMDKFMHFNGANTGAYESSDEWCEANIGTGTSIFNGHLNLASVAPINPYTSGLSWFLTPTGTDSQGHPIYVVPDKLSCSTMQGGSSGGTISLESIHNFMVALDYCFDMATSDQGGDPTDCLIPDGPIGGGLGGTLSGLTFESVDKKHENYFLSVDNSGGNPTVTATDGKFVPGLYRINLFLTDGNIIPVYRVLGVPEIRRVIDVSISPNAIAGSVLRFGITASQDTPVQILVQKLDGTTVYSESVNLPAKVEINREVSVSGDIPYKQLRVSVILEDGTVIQETALTE
ncbi:hypothetical protein [Fluviicola sp.]|uniref:hypothetical protein n=1 Tax=Fluviicola sp. TaxID=1917219 RepID=UPI00281A1DBC|nr:hypothetical protein [Fluviicola sp.]MDR0801891.1 hypothetical protein [Fluviicola sp.]